MPEDLTKIVLKHSKPFSVRVFNDTTLDVVKEFDTREEAVAFCKQNSNRFCLLLAAIEEFIPESWITK